MDKQSAIIMVESRQERNDPSAFRTVAVSTIVTTDEYGTTTIKRQRVAFDEIDAAIAKLSAKYALRSDSPHSYQIEGLRRLRASLAPSVSSVV